MCTPSSTPYPHGAAPTFKIAPLCIGIWTPSSTWFLRPARVHIPNGMSIGSAVFARLTVMTDRQTTLLCLWQQAASAWCCRTPPVNGPQSTRTARCTQPATQVCLQCKDHAQPATPTSHRSLCRRVQTTCSQPPYESQIPLCYLVADRFEAGRRPAAS